MVLLVGEYESSGQSYIYYIFWVIIIISVGLVEKEYYYGGFRSA
ncbi:hypothetical protein [endosymbiont 'TC1' of Trimyema compressum]|nr:hypothetical protein [endosymbiont 'TC1' of Trimyema compressum]